MHEGVGARVAGRFEREETKRDLGMGMIIIRIE